jgi:hypothetical protein
LGGPGEQSLWAPEQPSPTYWIWHMRTSATETPASRLLSLRRPRSRGPWLRITRWCSAFKPRTMEFRRDWRRRSARTSCWRARTASQRLLADPNTVADTRTYPSVTRGRDTGPPKFLKFSLSLNIAPSYIVHCNFLLFFVAVALRYCKFLPFPLTLLTKLKSSFGNLGENT